MIVKRIIDIILIFTLALQLLPANTAGRLLLFDLSDDDYADSCTCKAQLRVIEEDSKYVHTYHSLVNVPCQDITISLFHFSVTLPAPRALAIPTPPPDLLS